MAVRFTGMRSKTAVRGTPKEFIGYGPAADYLGLRRNTLSSYVTRGYGPRIAYIFIGQYVHPVFLRADLDRWNRNRPGQGARSDLKPVRAYVRKAKPVAVKKCECGCGGRPKSPQSRFIAGHNMVGKVYPTNPTTQKPADPIKDLERRVAALERRLARGIR